MAPVVMPVKMPLSWIVSQVKGTECITIDDYRKRYAQYRQDQDLQALHAALPMIAVWDDHELANDAWKKWCRKPPR